MDHHASVEQAKHYLSEKKWREAQELLQPIWEETPLPEIGILYSQTFEQAQQLQEALQVLQLSMLQSPRHLPLLFSLVRLLLLEERRNETLELLHFIEHEFPEHKDVMLFLGKVYYELSSTPQAIMSLIKAIELGEDSLECIGLLAHNMILTNHLPQAQQFFLIMKEKFPEEKETLMIGTNLYFFLGEFEQAISYAESYFSFYGHEPLLMSTYGSILLELGRLEEASYWTKIARELAPDHAETNYNAAFPFLYQKKWQEGFELLENRLRFWPGCDLIKKASPLIWKGESLKGKRLLVIHEQGFGDSLQFCRFLPLLQELLPREVCFAAPENLKDFFEYNQHFLQTTISTRDEEKTQFDYQIPLLSIPYYCFSLGLTQHIPFQHPYLLPSLEKIKEIPLLKSEKPKIGIAWNGLQNRWSKKSLPLHLLLKTLSQYPVEIVSLQKSPSKAEKALLKKFHVTDLDPHLTTFSQTSWALSQLNLLISVDTACAHLAGAQGTEVWLTLAHIPDWRWGLHEERSLWYHTAKLLRQKSSQDWNSIMEQIEERLKKKFHFS